MDVNERLARQELNRGAREPEAAPARPRPAATLVLARPRRSGEPEGGFEVLLLRRPRRSRFAAGAYVFPGGTLDPEDSAPQLLRRVPAALRREGPALVAGVRELFEETGFLVADVVAPPGPRRQARRELLEGSLSFLEVVRRLDVTFGRLEAVYLSRWVTPERLALRYDARFFLVGVVGPAFDEPELTGELESHRWVTAAEAVRDFREGRLPLLFPTRVTLERLAAHPTLEAAREACLARPVEPHRPRLLVRGESVRPVLPGDPGWNEAV